MFLLLLFGTACVSEVKVGLGGACKKDNDCTTKLCHYATCLDPNGDDDGDGLDNLSEKIARTSPFLADTDDDGFSDIMEVGPDLENPRDTDGDGLSDAVESATLDTDQDCVPDDRDPNNLEPATLAEAKLLLCKVAGVCAAHVDLIGAKCVDGALECDLSQVPDYEGDTELFCDGIDGDCDGQIDEDFPANGKIVGETCPAPVGCNNGVVVCTLDQTGAVCVAAGPTTGAPDLCDGLDNDCDGLTDEDTTYLGISAGMGCYAPGECKKTQGIVECNAKTGDAVCSTGPGGSSSIATLEICDGLDNDCDDDVDEDMIYVSPSGTEIAKGQPCGTGQCVGGVVACSGGVAVCTSQLLAGSEVCDGLDNDCDGQIDNGIVYFGLSVGARCDGIGECGAGVVECVLGTAVATCSSNAKGSVSESTPEVCDGLDNDCDGIMDNGVEWKGLPVGAACDGGGACGIGIVECTTQKMALCSTAPGGSDAKPQPEICDGIDNDCDGNIDNGLVGLADQCIPYGVCIDNITGSVCNNGLWVCTVPDDLPDYEVVETVCDFKDNDCDGVIDEFVTMVPDIAWIAENSAPETLARTEMAAVFDPEGLMWIVHGGLVADNGTPMPTSSTWSYSVLTEQWEEIVTVTAPDSKAPVAWDSGLKTVLALDVDRTNEKDLQAFWTLGSTGWMWTPAVPAAPEAAFGAAWVGTDSWVLRIGGQTTDGSPGHAWALHTDTKTWEVFVTDKLGAAATENATAVWDPGTQSVYVLGTKTMNNETVLDLWRLDVVSHQWTQLATTPVPKSLTRPGLAWDRYSGQGLAEWWDDSSNTPAWVSVVPAGQVGVFGTVPQPNTMSGGVVGYSPDQRWYLLLGGFQDGAPTSSVQKLTTVCGQ